MKKAKAFFVFLSIEFLFLPHLSSQVKEAWVARYDGISDGIDHPRALAEDGAGNVYVTGDSTRSVSRNGYDYVTIKYDSNGKQAWLARFDGGREDYARGIAVDRTGNVYVTGESFFNVTSYGSSTVKYSSTGRELWVNQYGSLSSRGILAEQSGNIYVAGTLESAESFEDFFILKYSPVLISFIRGDCNGDGGASLDLTDAIFLLKYNFLGGATPPCLSACDANGDDEILGQVTDAIYILQFTFLGGDPPPAPYPDCGEAADDLGCAGYPQC
ncbi:MAG: SBBP repeat-containing protein [Planctomycetes bacterium]|nr:SBBP repeat-containing protein [Planctomycetota bacterium]